MPKKPMNVKKSIGMLATCETMMNQFNHTSFMHYITRVMILLQWDFAARDQAGREIRQQGKRYPVPITEILYDLKTYTRE